MGVWVVLFADLVVFPFSGFPFSKNERGDSAHLGMFFAAFNQKVRTLVSVYHCAGYMELVSDSYTWKGRLKIASGSTVYKWINCG